MDFVWCIVDIDNYEGSIICSMYSTFEKVKKAFMDNMDLMTIGDAIACHNASKFDFILQDENRNCVNPNDYDPETLIKWSGGTGSVDIYRIFDDAEIVEDYEYCGKVIEKREVF